MYWTMPSGTRYQARSGPTIACGAVATPLATGIRVPVGLGAADALADGLVVAPLSGAQATTAITAASDIVRSRGRNTQQC